MKKQLRGIALILFGILLILFGPVMGDMFSGDYNLSLGCLE